MAESAVARRAGRVVLTVVGVATLVAGVLLGAERSGAWFPVPETGRPGLLSLRTLPDRPQWHGVSPGDVVHWRIAADLARLPASVVVQLSAEGLLVTEGRLRVRVAGCDEEFVATDAGGWRCEDGDAVLLDEVELAGLVARDPAPTWTLDPVDPRLSRYLLVTLTLPADAEVAGRTARVGVGVSAAGVDDAPVSSLPRTGADPVSLVLLAAGAALLGLAQRIGASRVGARGAGAP